jgi:hypothetical protein
MLTILVIVLLIILLGGGGGYYAHGRYGGAGWAACSASCSWFCSSFGWSGSSRAPSGPTQRSGQRRRALLDSLGTIRPHERLSRFGRAGPPRIGWSHCELSTARAQARSGTPQMDRALRRPLENRRILVVEDDPIIALDLQEHS